MARAFMVIGSEGTGKTSAIRTLNAPSTFILKPNQKELPFPGSEKLYPIFDPATGKGNVIELKELSELKAKILWVNKAPHIKTLVLDDLSHLYSKRILGDKFRNSEGFSKWSEFGAEVFNAVLANLSTLRSDLTIIILQHSEMRKDGVVADKTAGKLLTNTVDMPSWFTVVLHAMTVEKEGKTHYIFQTNKQGSYLAKSPAGMFKELYVRNDMQEILDSMKAYYEGKPQGEVKFI